MSLCRLLIHIPSYSEKIPSSKLLRDSGIVPNNAAPEKGVQRPTTYMTLARSLKLLGFSFVN